MLQPGSLQVPKPTGRSRFSKALPAIPVVAPSPEMPSTSTASVPAPVSVPTSSTPKVLPEPRTLTDLPPPPPPPYNDDPRVPIQFTPLPPLPNKKSVPATTAPARPKTPTSGPPKMTITRKPVGSKHQPQGSKSQMQPQETQPQVKIQSQTQQAPVQVQPQLQQKKEEQQLPQVSQKSQERGREKELPEPQSQQVSEQVQAQPQPQTQPQPQPLPPVPPKAESRSEPVSKPPQLPPLPSLLSPPQPQESFDAQNQQPPKSPSDSLSSLLSAYSRSSTASIVRSSDGTVYSAAEYQANEFPKPPTSTPNPAKHEGKDSTATVTGSAGLQPTQSLTQKPVAGGSQAISSQPPPAPPSKDDASQRPASPTRALNVDRQLPAPSPPRQQIWRRRSIKGSRDLPDLRLDHSHGSTASSSTISTVTAVQKPLPPSKSPPPPALSEKPTPRTTDSPSPENAPVLPSKDPPTMGNGGSKIERLKNKFHAHRGSSDSTKTAKKDQAVPAVNRPPTPEYQKDDENTAVTNTFISPMSPASSPEPAKKASQDASKGISEQISSGPSSSESKPVARKAVPMPPPALQPVKSLPDLKTRTPQTSNEPLPPASAFPSSGRNSPAFDSAPPRGRQPGPPGMYPPSSRNTSARPSSRGSLRPGGPPRFPRPDSDPRFVRSPSGEFMYKGRDGTLYPEMKELPDPDPKAARFPQQVSELPSSGAIFKAPALRQTHFKCYQKHKSMLRRPNRRYALACQTCQKEDTEDRFSCSFCYVRMCEACLKTFETKQRDLQALLDELSNNGTLSLSSPTRRGSALGLQINF